MLSNYPSVNTVGSFFSQWALLVSNVISLVGPILIFSVTVVERLLACQDGILDAIYNDKNYTTTVDVIFKTPKVLKA